MSTVLDTGLVTVPGDLAKRLQRAAKNQTKWRDERDDLIRAAYEAGGGVREIARLAGLSHPGVMRILRVEPDPGTPRNADGVPKYAPKGRE